MKDNYVLRSDAEAQIKVAQQERDSYKESISILAEELREAHALERDASKRAAEAETAEKAELEKIRAELAAEKRERERAEKNTIAAYEKRDEANRKHAALAEKVAKAEGELAATKNAVATLEAALKQALLLQEKEEKAEVVMPDFELDVDVTRDGANMIRSFKVRQKH